MVKLAFKDKSKTFEYNNKFNRSNYDRVGLMLPKGKKTVIQNIAKDNGCSMNAFICTAIDRMIYNSGGGFGTSSGSDYDISISRLFSLSELKKISNKLNEGETLEKYIKKCVLDTIK